MTSNEQGLLVARQDGVATITLNHPERANALDAAEFHTLAGLLSDLSAERGLITVVITGQGDRAFCAGLNLRDRAAIQSDIASPGPTGLSSALRAAAALSIPLLGRINGACVAGGMGLLGACDHVIAVDTARFGLPEIQHGIYPHVAVAGLHGRGAPSVVHRLADAGALIDAAAAHDAGLADDIVPKGDLDVALGAVISTIRSGKMLPRFQARRSGALADVHARLDNADNAARSIYLK